MNIKKIISGIVTSMFVMNTAIAATSSSFKIDVDSLNGGGNFGKSANFHVNDTTVGFVNGQSGISSSFKLGSGLVYLEVLCGNKIKEFGEQCDDGNLTNGDGCNSTCQNEAGSVCGNGIIQSGEQCDDGNLTNGDGCSSSCATETTGGGGGGGGGYSFRVCGNGNLESGEQCDDGNTNNNDGCSNICRTELRPSAPICGDRKIDDIEQCDDGNTKNGDGCSSFCKNEGSICGNKIKEGNEQCDDGNKSDNDNCSSLCRLTQKGEENEKNNETDSGAREIRIIAHPEKRVNATQNWGTTGKVIFYNIQLRKTMLVVDIEMNDVGWSTIKTDKLPEGNYIISFKGRSHLTKVIRQIKIDSDIQTIDFSFSGDTYLVAGDVHISKDDFIDGLDIAATVKALYSTNIDADLNKDGLVNGLDLGIVVGNIYKTGKKIKI